MNLFLSIKKKNLIIVSICLAVVIFVITLFSTKIVSVFFKQRKLPIYSVKSDEKVVALTFDCAWGVDYTDKLIEIMKNENITCTFFMVEFWATKYSDYVKKIDEAGFEIGTHSSTHPYMSKLTKEEMVKELTTSVTEIENIIGKKVCVFRPPYGDYNDNLIDCANQLNLFTIQWDVDSLDWKNLSATEIENRVLKRVNNGSIVLFHNNGLHTAEALQKIISGLKNQGYTFKCVGDLIYKENYKIDANGCQYSCN